MISSWFSGKAMPLPSHSLPSKNILNVYYSKHFRSAFNTGCSKIGDCLCKLNFPIYPI